MQFCGGLLFYCLLPITVLHCSVQQPPPQHVDQAVFGPLGAFRRHHGGTKPGQELTAKLLRLDDLTRTENDVMEPKRKRSFPGNGAPLDRLSISSMETKQGSSKQSKAAELPRRRANPPPVDRIGMGRIPSNRG
ncbi:osteocrin [Odontesthes bonariensis]|uniref:osteocrin n=1 Tax=Odontesthes bonariensis TaxID=219752 RepID=UPI003F5855C9